MPKRTTSTTDDLALPWWSERAERVPLNRKQILDAAIALIDRDGLEAFSLRKLAADLGVTTPALYTHVRNREELLVLVFDAVVSMMDLPDPDSTDWAGDLRVIARSWRATMQAHREMARLSAIGMPLGPGLLRRMDIVFGVLLGAGLPPRDAFSIGTAFAVNFMGYALFIDANNPVRQLERAGVSPETAKEQWAEMLGALPADAIPNIAALEVLLRGRHRRRLRRLRHEPRPPRQRRPHADRTPRLMERLVPAASELSVAEQAELTAGVDLWNTAGVDRLGLAGIGVSDGPSGARGSQFTGSSSTLLPCGTALASTWNRDLIGRVGRLLGDEARAKDASVLLAPTVNIHRHPLGGRNFECYSEDPYLTSEIAVALIEGVQSRGVGCAVKHFACNDQETDRMEIDVVVDERTRREIYLPPFEAAVRRARVWSVMAAYNRVDGLHCSEHAALLTDVLRGEWGFDGVVMSDWFGTRGVAALRAGLDLEMPGPPNALGHHLPAAIEAGDVTAHAVEQAAQRVLDLIGRTTPSRQPVRVVDGHADAAEIARAAASEAIVLLANDGVLPLDANASRLAVIGWRADQPEVQGGGSAQVTPPYVITLLQGIVDRAGPDAVDFQAGRVTARAAALGGRLLTPTDGASAPVRIDYFAAGDLAGPALHRETVPETTAVWLGEPAPGVAPGNFSARMSATFTPDVSGCWTLSVSGVGTARLFVDGELVADTVDAATGAGLLGLFTTPTEYEVELTAGSAHDVVAEFDAAPADGPVALAGLTVEARPPDQPDAFDRAVSAAAEADVAVVVVGRDDRESEGVDTPSMDLPANQVELVRRVAEVNARTVVVVNTASPVTMDWTDEVAAIVQLSYLGQEAGAALAAVLFGDVDATGRLTTTHPRRIEDSPAYANFPGRDGTVEYAEGIFVGYRHYDAHDVEPRWCFGHGLSYTTFGYSSLSVAGDELDDGSPAAVVSVDVTNTGARSGTEVVQAYVRSIDAVVPMAECQLAAFEKVRLEPGETTTVTLTLDGRAFAYWDTECHGWRAASDSYEILVGSSSRAIHQTGRV